MGPSDKLRRVATTLVEGCRTGREVENLPELYAENAVSVEAYDMTEGSGPPREARGLEAIRAKHDWWNAAFETVTEGMAPEDMARGPFYFGDDRFAVFFRIRTRDRKTGKVDEGSEIAVYHVKGGKIVREEFYYPM